MKKIFSLILILSGFTAAAQQRAMTSSEILHQLHKLNTVGNVLYVAAHPDDENTQLITWLANEKKLRTAYIALTRGDGGQNLIGTEQGPLVGLLRTNELLQARSVDGGEQYFTRALDFGFTKTTEEALLTWGKEKVLADLVWRIRNFQPDVIINRFPPDSRAGHGHHSASAVLSAEAFDAAADPTRYPEQLAYVKPWQAKRLFWNHYGRNFSGQADDSTALRISIADFNPLLGKSYGEISAEARSQHRSQGFGSAKVRNERTDYLSQIKGDKAAKDAFEGIDFSWNRVVGGAAIGTMIQQIIEEYDFKNPSKSVKGLVEVYKKILSLPNSVYKERKLQETKDLIASCAGLWLEAVPSINFAAPGDSVQVFIQATNRSTLPIELKQVSFQNTPFTINQPLPYNKQQEKKFNFYLPASQPISQPYWLLEKPLKGFYQVSDQQLIGLPLSNNNLRVTFLVSVLGEEIVYQRPMQYKFVEPSFGEIYKPFEVRPAVLVSLDQKVYTFNDYEPKKVRVTVRSSTANQSGQVQLSLPKGWTSAPAQHPFTIAKKNEEQTLEFLVTPTKATAEHDIQAVATVNGQQYNRSFYTLTYNHIPETISFPVAQSRALAISIKKKGNVVGYIAGAGDEVPAALQQIGYEIVPLTEHNFSKQLPQLQTIMVGVRAYNTEEWLPNKQAELMKFVENGGTVVTQYQTSAFYGKLKVESFGPYPFTIGRDRVTEEDAKVEFINPKHPLLNYPNNITAADFDGWVQERGLYFPGNYSDKYQTILRMNDTGEKPSDSSILYAPYGKGHFIFTGLSLFRQLPAGVAGSYKLMANMLSVGK